MSWQHHLPATRWLLPGIATLLLAACSTTGHKPADPAAEQAYQQRFDQLSNVPQWRLEGRLAADNGKDGGSGSLRWKQAGSLTEMSFRGAMGKGAWELQATQNQASLQFADGRSYTAGSIDQLVTTHMNAEIPVDALSWWVLGLASPGKVEDRSLDAEGRITWLRQFGWNVTFSAYDRHDSNWLPGKLVARNNDHTVKLAISKWSLLPGVAQFD